MSTQQLESFLAVAEHLNFARAAESLNITQSAVSRQIHALEDELETKLFHRTSRSVVLTPSGISFYEDAKNFMGGLRIAAAKIKRHSNSTVQLLSIGCNNANDCELLSNILQHCREQLPEVHPFLRIIPHRSIISLFFQGDLDVLFGFREDVPADDRVVYKELFQLPICCAFSAEHRYAEKAAISEQELYTENIVICNSYPISSKALSRQKRLEQRFPLDTIYYCDNPDAQITLVKAGYGFTVLPKAVFGNERIRYIPFEKGETVSYGFFYKKTPSNPLLKKFVSIAIQGAKDCRPDVTQPQ